MDNIKRLLNASKDARIKFGKDCDYGYHTHYIDGEELKGQRNTKERLTQFREHVNFEDKVVIDFGCCTGAMLLYLDEMKTGYGFDVDPKYIHAADKIKSHLKKTNVHFKQFNLERNLDKLEVNGDISMCLSLGSWIKNWKQLYKYCYDNTDIMILETNNAGEGKKQIEYVNTLYKEVKQVADSSPDDRTGNNRRHLWLCLK